MKPAVSRITGSMRDLGLANHASVRARIDGQVWLVDSSMLTNDPLPLGAGGLRSTLETPPNPPPPSSGKPPSRR